MPAITLVNCFEVPAGREDEFFTRYTPENPTTVYGPGGHPPGPYIVLPTSG